MTRLTHVLAAAAFTVGACGVPLTNTAWAQNQQEQQQQAQAQQAKSKQGGATTQPSAFLLVVPIPGERVAPAVIPSGTALAPDGEAIRDTLASATEAALTEGGFNDFVERLVDADRNRFGRYDPGDNSVLEAAAERVREAWQAKFGTDLDIEDEGDIYAPFSIVQGVINAPAEPAVKRMPANEPGDYNLEPGREVAVVTLPGRAGLPETTVLMIDEAFGWKIDVPNTRTPDQVHGNLILRFNAIADNAAKWPATREEATRYLTHQVMLAAVGKSQQAQEPQTAGSKQQGQ